MAVVRLISDWDRVESLYLARKKVAMRSSEPLHHFVNEYLAYLHESEPTSAAFDGVHIYDDLLEDVSRSAVESEIRELGGLARRLGLIDSSTLSGVEHIERPMLDAHIRARLHSLEAVREWERNPQLYGELLASSLTAQAIFDYAPAADRARRVVSKLRQTPRLIHAAKENVADPPGLFIKLGLETFRGVLSFIEEDLPRAFVDVDDLHLLGDLVDASTEAVTAITEYIQYLESELAPRAKGSFRLGRQVFEEKLRLEEGIDLSCPRLLDIAMDELRKTQEAFRHHAGRLGGDDLEKAWQVAKHQHPAAGALASVAQKQLAELTTYIERNGIVTLWPGDGVTVAPTPNFFRWTFASMWTPGPFETKPMRAYYYLTDVDQQWSSERQEEHLRDFNYGALWAISIHEVYPGHYLHYQHLKRIRSKLRKSIMFSATSFIEGWAHYCEQMMVDEGFGEGDPLIRLGQLSESLIRLARFVVGIRLHAEDLSVEQGMRFFRDEAFMEESNARREAERGTFDPGYVVYAAGKLMLAKLREDYEAQEGSKFTLKKFHDQLLANGGVPIPIHRRLMLNDPRGTLFES